MREVSRHLFIPRRPLIASMLSSDPERSWFRIAKASLIISTRPALTSASAPFSMTRRLPLPARRTFASIDRTTGSRSGRWPLSPTCSAAAILYCLPLETRETIQVENATDEMLQTTVVAGLEERAKCVVEDRGFPCVDVTKVAKISLAAIEKGFEEQGLAIARSISENDDSETETLVEIVAELVREMGLHGDQAVRTADVALAVIRSSFYASTEFERHLFNRWSKTYALLFAIQNEPRIVEWMRRASVRFRSVRRIGYHCTCAVGVLSPQGRSTRVKRIDILAAAGSTLVLAEPVLDEVWTHIVAADSEFRNHYAEQEPYLTLALVQACPRLLIRTYVYAKMRPIEGIQSPKGWMSLIDGFLPYSQLHRQEGKHALKQYLLEQYKMEFELNEDLQKSTDLDLLRALSDRFLPMKQHKGDRAPVLAKNDALMVLSVYGKRATLGEAHKPNPLGYRTWWLTKESSIRQETRDLVRARGAHYMMRPEWVMQYIALNPRLDAIRKSYSKFSQAR